MPTFDLKKFAADNQMKILNESSPGQYDVELADGSTKSFDANAFLKDNNIKASAIEANDMSTPFQDSHVSFLDRAALAVGNDKGRVSYLKKKYDDAKFTAENGLVVKDKGSWHTVDPTNWGGDGWSFAEAAKDILADNVDTALSVGSIAATTAGTGGVGGLVAAGTGGAIGRVAATALGKFIGTYDTSNPADTLKDIGWDAMLALGGQAVGLGAKNYVMPAIKKSLASIGENASPLVKNVAAKMLASQANVPEYNAVRLLENPKSVMGIADELLAQAKSASPKDLNATMLLPDSGRAAKALSDSELAALGKNRVIADVGMVAKNANKWVSSKFDGMEKALVEQGTRAPNIDLKAPSEAMFRNLQELNLVSNNGQSFKAATADDLARMAGITPLQAKPIAKELAAVVEAAQALTARPVAGKNAVQQVISLRRRFDDLLYNSIDALGDRGEELIGKSLRPIISDFKAAITEQLPSEIKNGLMEMNAFYSVHKPIAVRLSKAATTPDGMESFVNKLYSEPDKFVSTKGMLDQISQLHPSAPAVMNRVYDTIAAQDFVRMLPKGGNPLKADSVFGAAKKLTGMVASGGAVGPRGLGNRVRALPAAGQSLLRVRDFARGLPPEKLKELLGNEQAFQALIQATLKASQSEDATTEQLIKQAASGQ